MCLAGEQLEKICWVGMAIEKYLFYLIICNANIEITLSYCVQVINYTFM